MKRTLLTFTIALFAVCLALPASARRGRDKGTSSVAVTEGTSCNAPKEDNLIESDDILVWITITPLVSLDDLVWSLFGNGTSGTPVDDGDFEKDDAACSVGNRSLVELEDLDTGLLTSKPNGRPESYTLVVDLESGENYGADSFRWAD